MGLNKTPARTAKLLHYLDLIAAAQVPAAVLRAVQSYLNSWPKERIESVQRVDGGWAPFNLDQRPLWVNGVRDLRRIRDVVHCHCIFLNDAGMPPTPELTELDEFFCIATEKAESVKQAASPMRTPPVPSHQYLLENW